MKLWDKSEPDFTAHVGDVRMNTTEGRVSLFALAPRISSLVREVGIKKKKFSTRLQDEAPCEHVGAHLFIIIS